MARWPGSKKTTVEQCLALGVFAMGRAGVFLKSPRHSWTTLWRDGVGAETNRIGCSLQRDPSGGLEVCLSYAIKDLFTGETRPVVEPVALETTLCHFGGKRYWFVCPLRRGAVTCGRRVGKLYLPPRATYFGCRHCYDLTYRSCQQHDKRMDALAKLPIDSLLALSESGSLASRLLAMSAVTKRLRRW